MRNDFHERLARAADAVRALPDGEETARALMRLAADLDAYLDDQLAGRYEQGIELLHKFNDFVGENKAAAHRYGVEQLATERRKLARIVAADPRWQGGYADALALLTRDE